MCVLNVTKGGSESLGERELDSRQAVTFAMHEFFHRDERRIYSLFYLAVNEIFRLL